MSDACEPETLPAGTPALMASRTAEKISAIERKGTHEKTVLFPDRNSAPLL